MKRYFSLLVSALLILSLFAGCGSSSSNDGAPEAGAMVEEMNSMANDRLAAGAEPGKTQLPENRKWVITSEMHAETYEMDATLDAILEKVYQLQGYVEDQSFDNGSYYEGPDTERSARMTIRVPAAQIDDFLETMKEHANVLSSSKNLEDITLQYSDTETRIAALEAERDRLMELMEQAETMSDLLEIERRLTDVQYELENVNSRLRLYDNQVNYATIHLTLNEVRVYTPVKEPTFLERISTGFVSSVHGVAEGLVDLVVLLIVASPYLVVWGVIILIIVLIVKVSRNKGRKTKKPVNSDSEKPIPEEWKKFDKAEKETFEKEEKK